MTAWKTPIKFLNPYSDTELTMVYDPYHTGQYIVINMETGTVLMNGYRDSVEEFMESNDFTLIQ